MGIRSIQANQLSCFWPGHTSRVLTCAAALICRLTASAGRGGVEGAAAHVEGRADGLMRTALMHATTAEGEASVLEQAPLLLDPLAGEAAGVEGAGSLRESAGGADSLADMGARGGSGSNCSGDCRIPSVHPVEGGQVQVVGWVGLVRGWLAWVKPRPSTCACMCCSCAGWC